MGEQQQQTPTRVATNGYSDSTTWPAPPSGGAWRPVDASTAVELLKSTRKGDVFSPAHPIIASIRAVGMSLPGASGYTTRSLRSTLLLACRCGGWRVAGMFDVRKAIRRGGAEMFCSIACREDGKWNRGRIHWCRRCGGPIPQERKLTCSAECRRAEVEERWTFLDCPMCGDSFHPKVLKQQFCSRDCADEAHSFRMVGEGNANHKDGISYGKWFVSMRPLIRERDEERCVACRRTPEPTRFMRGGKQVERSTLSIHHINEDIRDNTPGNLITLCTTCHARHHQSEPTPYPWFGIYAHHASLSMTSRWKARATSLQAKYSYTTVS